MCTIGVSRQTSKLVPWGRGGPPVCPYGGPYELGLWDWLGAASSKGLETLMLSPAPWFGTPTPSSEVNKQWLAYTMLCASFSVSLSVKSSICKSPTLHCRESVTQLNVNWSKAENKPIQNKSIQHRMFQMNRANHTLQHKRAGQPSLMILSWKCKNNVVPIKQF